MDLTNLPPGMIGQLSGMVEDFILKNQKRYSFRATPLTYEHKAAMQSFFPSEVLEQTRVIVLHGERILDPPFYSMARVMGIKNLPSFSDTAAVTFVDVVASHEELTDDLLFHELVHVAQYAAMGTKEFASRYVNGFLNGGSYAEIPMEKHAYTLTQRYTVNKTQAFSVADEVKSWIDTQKFEPEG
ncbi:MAG: hypothetical protein ACHP79_06620 [Terriglobales bacterium]